MKKQIHILMISLLAMVCTAGQWALHDSEGERISGFRDARPLGAIAGTVWVEYERSVVLSTNVFEVSTAMQLNAAKYKALINTVLQTPTAYTNQVHNFAEKQEELASVDSIPQSVKLDLKTLHEVLTSWNARHGLPGKGWAFPFGETNVVMVSTNTVWEVVE